MKTFKNCLIILVFPLLLACQTGAKALYEGLGRETDPVPLMEKARTGSLASGLTYYILENSQPAGRAFLALAVNAGSVLEAEDERGLAHFVEHMAFNGTARFPEAELINYLRSLGMRFGPDANAYTSFDETVYEIQTPVEEDAGGVKRIPARALAIIDDWSHAVSFAPKDVDEERPIIMEEYRSRLGAQERIQKQILPVLFKGSPYAVREPIGLPEIIETAPAERLMGFYRKWYKPENMAVIMVGDFDGAALEASLAEHFHIQKSTGNFRRPLYDLPAPKKGSIRSLILTDQELTQTRVDLYYKLKNRERPGDLGGYRESIIDYLAGTMLFMRFDDASSKPETPYMAAGAGNVRYGHSSRFYILVGRAKAGQTEKTLRELLAVKESLARYGFTEDEADIARRSLLSDMEKSLAEKDHEKSDSFINSFTNHFLKGETAPGIEWEYNAVQKLLPGITIKEINDAVKKWFAEDDLSVFITAPESEKGSLLTEAGITEIVKEVSKMKIAPPKTAAAASGGLMDYAPAPGSIVAESTDDETGALRWRLSNGMELILKQTANRSSEVTLYAEARGGIMNAPPEMDASASLASEMLGASGLGPYSRPELTRKLMDKQVSFSFWASRFLRGFQGSSASRDLATLFEMIHLSFTRPRFDPEAIQVLLENRRTGIEREAEDPNSVFNRELIKTAYGNSRFHVMDLEELAGVNIKDAASFITACSNPQDYTFVFAGNIDIDRFRELAETYLASIPAVPPEALPGGRPFNQWADADFGRPGAVRKDVYKGKEARSIVYLGWFVPVEFSEKVSAAASVLNEYMDIRLTEDIRESLGGVYSISSAVSVSPVPRGELSGAAYFICDPGQAPELSSAVEERLRAVASGAIDGAVFDKSVEALLKDHEISLQNNLTICQSYANSAVIYRSPLSRLDKRPSLYRAVSHKDIQDAAARLLEGGPVRVILFPKTEGS
jgi:zinc protease